MLEEQSTALKDQVKRTESEITKLRDQLELVRREKHEVEEERAENAKQRDKEVITFDLILLAQSQHQYIL